MHGSLICMHTHRTGDFSRLTIKRRKISFFADCSIAHAATGKGWFVFIFLKNLQFFKKIKTNLFGTLLCAMSYSEIIYQKCNKTKNRCSFVKNYALDEVFY